MRQMQKHILIPLALFALATSVRSGDMNQAAGASANKAAQDNEALIALAAVGNTGDAAQITTVSTNKPAWESSISAGLSLTKGNSDTLLTTVAYKTRKKTRENEFTFGADGENDNVKNNETCTGSGNSI